jgi:2-polyprenyl-6-methoxyphenol hydroxylase-like FAD-dependent oxidoreductase
VFRHLSAALAAPEDLRLGSTVESVSSADGAVVTSEGGDRGDLVVAADGIGSHVRAALFPAHPGPRYTELTAWRLLTCPARKYSSANGEEPYGRA